MNMKFNINNNGGQVNIADDNSSITAIQKNGTSIDELVSIKKNILENLPEPKLKNDEQIREVINSVKEEWLKSQPESSKLKDCIKSISSIITTVNGISVLGDNLSRLIKLLGNLQ